jgi:hypothetical protein
MNATMPATGEVIAASRAAVVAKYMTDWLWQKLFRSAAVSTSAAVNVLKPEPIRVS